MPRRGASLILLFAAALVGCRSGGDKRSPSDAFVGPDRSGEPTSRTGPISNPDSPAHWLDRPKPDWMHGATPAAPSWNDPKDPGYDLKTEASGLLAGYVVDPDGRKVGGVFIEVRESGDANAKPIGVLSLPSGAFTIQGLKPNKNYQLAVNANVEGRKLFQTVYVKTPSPNVRLALLEADPSSTPGTTPLPKLPSGDAPATDPLKKSPTNEVPNPNAPLPTPKFSAGDRDPGIAPVGGYEMPPSSNDALPQAERFDLMTDQGPLPWKPPVANIPLPRIGQPIPSATPPTRGESRKVTDPPVAFVDGTGRQVGIPNGKLILLSFHTAGSMACVRAVPTLNEIREKYAERGVEVVGVGCEDEPLNARVMAADLFRKDHGVKYTLVTEPDRRPGDLLKQYGVTELPAAVLLDERGTVLWQGNPNKPTGLTEAIETGLR